MLENVIHRFGVIVHYDSVFVQTAAFRALNLSLSAETRNILFSLCYRQHKRSSP